MTILVSPIRITRALYAHASPPTQYFSVRIMPHGLFNLAMADESADRSLAQHVSKCDNNECPPFRTLHGQDTWQFAQASRKRRCAQANNALIVSQAMLYSHASANGKLSHD